MTTALRKQWWSDLMIPLILTSRQAGRRRQLPFDRIHLSSLWLLVCANKGFCPAQQMSFYHLFCGLQSICLLLFREEEITTFCFIFAACEMGLEPKEMYYKASCLWKSSWTSFTSLFKEQKAEELKQIIHSFKGWNNKEKEDFLLSGHWNLFFFFAEDGNLLKSKIYCRLFGYSQMWVQIYWTIYRNMDQRLSIWKSESCCGFGPVDHV